ncbi:DUF4142 domain-containing protein [Sphingomonas morindae]|uniref:DUF4142 domain-containing protein n=1 Tax=Sphingomonas morindae TaxID=1541170 RepID=A0ABY4X5N0_9SPHN|nr:DUF4142 domain-containing protein [Sphingomonas morindae]USI72189.1 DUF4142 domain-containing protein [Sphingomonas morindae]
MLVRHSLLVAALGLGLAAGAQAQTATSPKDFVAKAGASDQFEIQSSRLELASSNREIKSFAQQMITDHTKSTAMVTKAASQDKLPPMTPKLTPDKARKIAQLKAVKGAERDRLYVTQQQAAHQEALALMQDYANNGTATHLKQAAGEIAPIVQHHLEMVQGLSAQ